jgi:hypothetical protein
VTPTTLYTATPGGVFKSTNDGASWSASGLSSVFSLVIDPLTPTTLYAGSYGVFKSTDGGASWNPTGGLPTWSPWVPAGAVATLAIDPQTPTTIYAGTLGSLIYIVDDFYRSLDGGQSWEGSYAVFMMSIACNPCGGIVALAAAPQTVLGVMAAFTSYGEDGSVYWEAPSQVTHGNLINPGFAVAIDPVTPTTLYAGTYKSTNDGATWFATGLTGVGGVQALAIDPLTPTTLYAGSLDAVHKSVDGGTTWIATGLTNVGGVRTLAIDPLTPTTLYAGTGTGGVYKSTNGGASWSPTGLVTWSHISSLSLNPASVVGGSPATGTVTLNAPAPADGTLVQLSTGPQYRLGSFERKGCRRSDERRFRRVHQSRRCLPQRARLGWYRRRYKLSRAHRDPGSGHSLFVDSQSHERGRRTRRDRNGHPEHGGSSRRCGGCAFEQQSFGCDCPCGCRGSSRGNKRSFRGIYQPRDQLHHGGDLGDLWRQR